MSEIDATLGSSLLLAAQIRAGQIFPVPMEAWRARHQPALRPQRAAFRHDPVLRGSERAQRILHHIAQRSGFTVAAIVGDRGSPHLSAARRRAIRLLARCGFSPRQTAKLMKRDRSTIIHHLGRRAA